MDSRFRGNDGSGSDFEQGALDFDAKHRSPSVSRRALLAAGLAGIAGWTLPRAALAASTLFSPAPSGDRRFSVLYKGDRIGDHTVSYSSETGETRVETEIHLLVKIAFFTMFSFSHSSQEIWHSGRLLSLRSDTEEDGEALHIDGAATPRGFRVMSPDGPFIASAATFTSNSLWTPSVLAQVTVVDAQHGGIIGVSAGRLADEQIIIAGETIRATRYRLITPYLAGSIWYDDNDLWVKGEFERNGAKILYQLET
jgi:hypothetical protein